MPAIKFVTFDLDNTLWDVDTVVRRAELRMRAWLTERVPEFPIRCGPEAMLAIRDRVLATEPRLRHDLSRLRETMLFEAVRTCGLNPGEARTTASAAFQIFFEARHDVAFFPHALETLEALAGRYRLAALTNGNASFRKLGLDRYFSFGFSAADVGAGKPAPDMFHAALREAGAAPAESIHVGDHLIDDIQGAGNVGMHTIWVNLRAAAAPAPPAGPTHRVAALTEIPQRIESIRAAL
jgi:HAD superfamily hydrolase (TIGR01509 family)